MQTGTKGHSNGLMIESTGQLSTFQKSGTGTEGKKEKKEKAKHLDTLTASAGATKTRCRTTHNAVQCSNQKENTTT